MRLGWTLALLVAAPVTARPAKPHTQVLAPALAVADGLLGRDRAPEALSLLAAQSGPAAALLRARAARGVNDLALAQVALREAASDAGLAELVAVERGLVALATGDTKGAAMELLPVLHDANAAIAPAALPFAEALAVGDPLTLLDSYDALDALRDHNDPNGRSRLLAAKTIALRGLGREAEALAVETQRYLEEPVSLLTPSEAPAGVTLSASQRLARIEVLLLAHRNERVVEAAGALADESLSAAERCQKELALGLAARKLRDYANAETHLTLAGERCLGDEERQRRARYLNAKVVSIRDGLRAVPLIEQFASEYGDHSMVDDVLFWAGDLYQRRGHDSEAEAYYARIGARPLIDDQCSEAAWRLAWMSYRRGEFDLARTRLLALLANERCVLVPFDKARADYWLGRIAQAQRQRSAAESYFRAAFTEEALGFYAQLALVRLGEVSKKAARTLAQPPPNAPRTRTRSSLCAGVFASEPAYDRATRYLSLGLHSDAARQLLAIKMPERQVLSTTHANALGLAPHPARGPSETTSTEGGPVVAQTVQPPPAHPSGAECSDHDAKLTLALLLDGAGDYKDAHWRLRTDFAADLDRFPTPATVGIWRAAYPLAWRSDIAPAEKDNKLPELFLQALAREESAFDPLVVSWAGAYGLTQLLLSTGRDAGRLLKPPVHLARAEDLLDPALNARLGGAMLAAFMRRFGGNAALALAAYNAGGDVATTWWKRHEKDELDVLAEEMTIQETRGYVKRVLRTFGIYRWLYAGAPPELAISLKLPPAPL